MLWHLKNAEEQGNMESYVGKVIECVECWKVCEIMLEILLIRIEI